MLRASSGVVTALVANDPKAVTAQILSMVKDQVELSAGDPAMLTFRMIKQLEASARVTQVVLRSLSSRLGASDAEVQEILAQAWIAEA
jgi:hypothetical protein